jgi:hypothetical protein
MVVPRLLSAPANQVYLPHSKAPLVLLGFLLLTSLEHQLSAVPPSLTKPWHPMDSRSALAHSVSGLLMAPVKPFRYSLPPLLHQEPPSPALCPCWAPEPPSLGAAACASASPLLGSRRLRPDGDPEFHSRSQPCHRRGFFVAAALRVGACSGLHHPSASGHGPCVLP